MTKAGYYEFEVHLADIKPRIWRQFLITADATFADLHNAIQMAFGWEDAHLWEFMEPAPKEGIIAGAPDDDFGDESEEDDTPDARTISVATYFDRSDASNECLYIYDFGDGWFHHVVLTQKVAENGDFERKLVAGERACPPEDCGGVPGYERMVEFLATGTDPDGEDAEDLAEWVGNWRPDDFDLGEFQEVFDR